MSRLVLHGYWRSSAAYRVRIALNLKGVAYDQITHDLRTGAQRDPSYLMLAPAGLVPAIEHDGQAIVQSPAILEWIEERWSHPPLLPAGIDQRAIVRAMASTIGADIHPINNLRIVKYLKSEFERSQEQVDRWATHWISEGFAALETLIAQHGGDFAFGNIPTIADCFLVPQAYNADRIGVDLSPYPHLLRAVANARAHPAFAAAHPDRQPDAAIS